MAPAIIATVGVLTQIAIFLANRLYVNRLAKKANDDKLEAIEHEKIAVEVLHHCTKPQPAMKSSTWPSSITTHSRK